MRSNILTLSTLVALTSAQSTSLIGAVIPLGADCVPDGTPCALGAQCYATNSGLQPRCGNFQSACTSDQQCAFNTCNLQQGLCNGILSSSVASVSASITVAPSSTSASAGYSGAPSPTVSAPAGSLPLGAECNPFVQPSQCAGGAQCWASNAGLIARCGNFNAACTSNSQCAVNTCNNGLCNGLLPSSSVGGGNVTMSTMMPSRTPTKSGSASATSSSGFTQFTGAAAVKDVAGGVVAVALGGLALLL